VSSEHQACLPTRAPCDYLLAGPTASGLDMDVQGASYWGGAEIDGWYPNNQLNQVFSTPGGGTLG
jgi:hypothetical protein